MSSSGVTGAAALAGGSLRQPPRPWVAVVADQGGLEAPAELPQRQLLVPAPAGGRGFAIFATPGGEMPPTARRGAVGVVFEGALINSRELSSALDLEPGASRSDAELVVRAYERWGEAMAARLRGPLALCLWDGEAQRLIASRDRIGIQQLVFCDTGREIVLSSSADLVRLHPGVPRELHRARLAELLTLHIFDVEETPHAAIRRVAPGHRWIRDAQGERQQRNWELSAVGQSAGTLEEHLDRFEALMDQAVERAIAPGDLGLLLSGGLDSVSIASTAAKKCRELGIEVPRALSLVFPDEEANEESRQRAVATQLGLPLTMLGFYEACGGESKVLRAGAEASRKFPSPALTLWRPSFLSLLAAGRRAGSRVVLTGHGGDEWLGVSVFLAADFVQRREFGKLWRFFRVRRRSFHLGLMRSLRNVFWRYGARPVLAGAATKLLGSASRPLVRLQKRRHFRRALPAWVAPDPALRRELTERAQRYLPEPTQRDFYLHENRTSLSHASAAVEYEEVFEVGRQIGVAFASPFLDEDLVEFLLGVPPEILYAGERAKGLVRTSVSRRFPELGFGQQRKVAATSFFRRLVRDQGTQAVAELGGLTELARLGVVDLRRWRSYTESRIARNDGLELARIWMALSSEAWARAHG